MGGLHCHHNWSPQTKHILRIVDTINMNLNKDYHHLGPEYRLNLYIRRSTSDSSRAHIVFKSRLSLNLNLHSSSLLLSKRNAILTNSHCEHQVHFWLVSLQIISKVINLKLSQIKASKFNFKVSKSRILYSWPGWFFLITYFALMTN